MIDREFIRSGGLSEALAGAASHGLLRLTTPAERLRSRAEILAARACPDTDVWVFAYGSLMWNPTIHYTEQRAAKVYGYHRRFCLNVPVGRGTREQPGLLLGLDRGGACRGIVFRIAAAEVERELDILWARELVADGYRPVWVRARAESALQRAITFVIDRSLPTYAGRLPLEDTAQRIASAAGALGSCADYLEETVAHLHQSGIHDPAMRAILQRVRELHGALSDT
ncbi:MAG: gamma-glutamylcyclotransferase [Gammaproteobacteria bacterium]|nr:gamma-glutamylcyclotransferase [Gammaproteobacteria bacterium]